MAALGRVRLGILAAILALTAVAGVLRYTDLAPVVLFFVSLGALAGLAWAISFSTEALGERIGAAATGVLQATLGNIPEISVVLFALAAGETVVAKTSLLGALFSNALLVLGLAIVAGSWRAPDIHAIDPAVDALGVPRAFTGLVIVAIAGNAVENTVAVTMALKGSNDLAISVVKNAVSQTAVVVFPVLVLLSLFFSERLTFVLDPIYIGALFLTAVAIWQITGDGEAAAFEGWALVALFAILGVLTWYE